MKLLAFLLVLLLNGCTLSRAEVAFVEGNPHVSTLDYRLYFETRSAAVETCTLSIQQSIYEPERAQRLLAKVGQDLRTLADAAGVTAADFQPHVIYVVERPLNGMERQGDHLYCSPADIENGSYRSLLAGAALGTEEYWKGVGMAGCAFSEAPDGAKLADTYRQLADLDILSLFISYYTAPFATEAETALAEQTAAALCRYIIDTNGVKALAEEDCISYRQEWLKHIGVEREYADPYYRLLTNYRFTLHASYPLVAINQYNHRIYLEQMQDMSSAKDLRMFLYDMLAGPQAVLSLVAEQDPERLDAVKSRYEGRLWVYCGSTDGSYTYVEGRNIYLQLSYAYLHELGHILFPTPKGANFYSQMWQYEGLCDYLCYAVYPTYAREKSYYEALQYYMGLDQVEDKTPNQRFYVKLLELYQRRASLPETAAEVDVALFIDCMAAVPLIYPDAAPDSDWVQPVSAVYPALRKLSGNELTYHQAYAFASWLIKQHSFAGFLDYCLEGRGFEKSFGMPYDAVKGAWLADFVPIFQ